ncbi:rlp [Trichoplusia ni granulovirus LBIV-12]|jgi:hypothetical protein|uniref:Rlp n=2 Tax=Betabaculovirus TaxID=558017 RepID=A0A1D8QL89_GVTN|nr:Rep-like protein [Pseudalatia unipuncta granulovirus]YP_009506141.1 rlp [Trichoplusia ni granulovirus LBIV-12]ACH69430.1 Rep-like protein [Pseudalatia unipuncta granulovirus]AOW41410.1 rlp [Trichoplusia ni granulovirus LBIV-12]
MDREAKVLRTMFLDGTFLDVVSHYDETRGISGRVMIRVDSILRILDAPVIDAILKEYNSLKVYLCVWDISFLITQHMKLHLCENGKYNSCKATDLSPCPHKHSHHFCSTHVQKWIEKFLAFECYLHHQDKKSSGVWLQFCFTMDCDGKSNPNYFPYHVYHKK